MNLELKIFGPATIILITLVIITVIYVNKPYAVLIVLAEWALIYISAYYIYRKLDEERQKII
jgi:hypothetical protein